MEESELEEIVLSLKEKIMIELPISQMTDQELEEQIEQFIHKEFQYGYLSIAQKVRIADQVYSSIRGLDFLDGIMNNEKVTEIMINGHQQIFLEMDGVIKKCRKKFISEQRLADIIQRIVGQAGREVNQANPIVDTKLANGARVNVVLPPVSLTGPIVTIRKFSKQPMTMERLVELGSLSSEIAEELELLVRAKYNIFISGGTGSGKTTFLNALSNYIPENERVITIEDSAELQIARITNLVRLETRNANSTGMGQITMRDLIRTSLRMRPERIIVGEVRGAEALDMLQAMNTGHDGSLSTGHGNSTKDMLSRLETMVLMGATGLPLAAIRQQIASALDIIIHLSRQRDHSRKTVEISEVLQVKDGEIELNPLYVFAENDHTSLHKVSGSLVRTKNDLKNDYKLRLAGLFEQKF